MVSVGGRDIFYAAVKKREKVWCLPEVAHEKWARCRVIASLSGVRMCQCVFMGFARVRTLREENVAHAL